MSVRLETRKYKVFHFFCGLGGGAKGFRKGSARLGNREATFENIGGIDVDAASIENFNRLAGCTGTVMDLFSLDQYLAFHGHMPPPGWREVTTTDIHRAAHYQRPDVVFLSAPCKGFSGLLSQVNSLTAKYQALNELTLRGVFLMCEAWKDDPPSLIVFENVPRIMTRGRKLLDLIVALLRHYGYAVAETTHDCGEIGGLAQSRKRFLLVARHQAKVPPFLYEPVKQRMRGVGEILDQMPLPGDPEGGPMHRIPSLQWKTWVRLAFVEAGSDWRSLNKLNVEDGYLKDYLVVPEYRAGYLGVNRMDEPMGTVAGRSTPSNGAFSIADMRMPANSGEYSQYGVMDYAQTAGTVTAQSAPGGGVFSVADPRGPGTADEQHGKYRVTEYSGHSRAVIAGRDNGAFAVQDPRPTHGPGAHTNKFHIVPYAGQSKAVTGSDRVGSGAACVQDPRPSQREDYKQTKYRVTGMAEASGAVIAASTTGNGAFAVADPRPRLGSDAHRYHETQGHYGVLPYDQTSKAVPGFASHDNGSWSVADGRPGAEAFFPQSDIILPSAADRLTCIIRALDGTWHRPFTTLELAALQSLIDLDNPETWRLFGTSDSQWREQIGNAVPADSATGMADTFGLTLLMAEAGETFRLSNTPIWVQPLAVALSVDTSMVPA